MTRRFGLGLALLAGIAAAQDAPAPANAQPVLTLAEAVRLARERNGTLRASQAQVRGARAGVDAAYAAFFPSVSPVVQYSQNRNFIRGSSTSGGNNGNNGGAVGFTQDGYTFGLTGSVRLLDFGQRNNTYALNQLNFRGTEQLFRQTRRQTVFDVESQYLEVLRAQALERVQAAQVERSNTILRQTERRVEVGDAARKDTLQARADALNAEVNAITAQARTATNEATLKSTIGLEATEQLPPLQPVAEVVPTDDFGTLPAAVQEGLQNRPDLQAGRFGERSQEYAVRNARLNTGVTVAADASLGTFARPSQFSTDGITISLSYPLFDAGASRAALRQQQAELDRQREVLRQNERVAVAEIESAYAQYGLGTRRLAAATAAREAAQTNYDAAVRARELGAGTLLDVLTAQVSLVTAETNYIEALYDTLIARRRLELATGRPLPLEG